MQKNTAILFLLLLGISLFTRQLGYLECRLMNKILPVSSSCDCEKLLVSSDQDSNPFQHPPAHFHPDEFFLTGQQLSTQYDPVMFLNKYPHLQENTCSGNRNECWQPPESCLSILS